MHKREGDGIVMVDTDKCRLWCLCVVLPLRCATNESRNQTDVKMRLLHRFTAKGEQPVCVATCPLGAIQFGPIDELRERYGDLDYVTGLPSLK